MGAGLFASLKRWWCMMIHTPERPEFEEMRRRVRELVHKNRNLAMEAHGAAKRSTRVSNQAAMASYDAIDRLEEARRKWDEQERNGREKPST